MAAPRRGVLTNAQTLRLYEQGQPIIGIALAEGLTVHGVLIRLYRERCRRRDRGDVIRRRQPQPIYAGLWELAGAMDDLSAAIERMTRRSRRSVETAEAAAESVGKSEAQTAGRAVARR